MHSSIYLLMLVMLFHASNGFLFKYFNRDNWNGLKVTFNINVFNKYAFDSQPRTVNRAVEEGFVKLSDCTEKFRGSRYFKDGDYGLVLLYDIQGYIAGIQAGIRDNQTNNYPFKDVQPPFIKDGDHYFITAYFVNPATICSVGRSEDDFKDSGTGTGLFFQNGENPDTDYMEIPLAENELASTKWTKGKCFTAMGQHYWYNLSKNMSCTDYFPAFLLYSSGHLNGFGWAFLTPLTSPRYEHPQPQQFSAFIEDVPTCLNNQGTISTMHIYMTDSPSLNLCF